MGFNQPVVRWLTITLGLLALLCANGLAQSPTMTITSSLITEEDVDEDRPGYQFLITYNVRNTSPLGDINNMIKFRLPAGSNQGI